MTGKIKFKAAISLNVGKMNNDWKNNAEHVKQIFSNRGSRRDIFVGDGGIYFPSSLHCELVSMGKSL